MLMFGESRDVAQLRRRPKAGSGVSDRGVDEYFHMACALSGHWTLHWPPPSKYLPDMSPWVVAHLKRHV